LYCIEADIAAVNMVQECRRKSAYKSKF